VRLGVTGGRDPEQVAALLERARARGPLELVAGPDSMLAVRWAASSGTPLVGGRPDAMLSFLGNRESAAASMHAVRAGLWVGTPVRTASGWDVQWWRMGEQRGPMVDGRSNRTPFTGPKPPRVDPLEASLRGAK